MCRKTDCFGETRIVLNVSSSLGAGKQIHYDCLSLLLLLLLLLLFITFVIVMVFILCVKWMQALFRRAQLKALVTMHSIEENYGGHLSATEINIIGGALDLTSKTAAHGMTPLDKVRLQLNTCCFRVNKLLSNHMYTGNTA